MDIEDSRYNFLGCVTRKDARRVLKNLNAKSRTHITRELQIGKGWPEVDQKEFLKELIDMMLQSIYDPLESLRKQMQFYPTSVLESMFKDECNLDVDSTFHAACHSIQSCK
eukprot:TRINITY_DN26583_c0_g1_i2.p1 TRINITY_DN26583_c0_g1~~TRINITY_DN26583_c0_g1_i2.p1  ORF type:complete len:111 (+),score=9.45 TRINITY_DN26583_c0_g1_i2:163-495(+)